MTGAAASIHASAVLIGERAVLIRGPSGAGKSRLVFELLASGGAGRFPFVRLIADDRCILSAVSNRLLVRAPEPLQGKLELRGVGIGEFGTARAGVVGLVVDLAFPDAERLPEAESRRVTIEGIELPRLAVAACAAPLPMITAVLMPARLAKHQTPIN